MIVSFVAFVVVSYFVYMVDLWAKGVPIVLGLILVGVIGNFWDRVVDDYVRDFIDFHAPSDTAFAALFICWFKTATWPTFNVADMFIIGGVIVMFFFMGRVSEFVAVVFVVPMVLSMSVLSIEFWPVDVIGSAPTD